MKFRKKTAVIDATQFFIDQPVTHEHVNFGWPKTYGDTASSRFDGRYWIGTVEGQQFVNDGDWIVTGSKGDRYPIRPDTFDTMYEAVE